MSRHSRKPRQSRLVLLSRAVLVLVQLVLVLIESAAALSGLLDDLW